MSDNTGENESGRSREIQRDLTNGRFKPGNRSALGGRRAGAGSPTNEKRRIKKLAAEMAREYIEKNVKPVLGAYLDLAKGRNVKRMNQITGEVYDSFEVDPPTTRHYIDKIIPAAKQEIELSGTFKIIKMDVFDPDEPIDVTPGKLNAPK